MVRQPHHGSRSRADRRLHCVAAIGAALLPLWSATRADVSQALRAGAAASRRDPHRAAGIPAGADDTGNRAADRRWSLRAQSRSGSQPRPRLQSAKRSMCGRTCPLRKRQAFLSSIGRPSGAWRHCPMWKPWGSCTAGRSCRTSVCAFARPASTRYRGYWGAGRTTSPQLRGRSTRCRCACCAAVCGPMPISTLLPNRL
jgi:hypothetical protein